MSGSCKPLPLAVTGISSTIGEVIGIDEFAARLRFPDRRDRGRFLDGEFLRSRLGLDSKSWDRERFGSSATLASTARDAMESAGLRPSDIDCFLAVTCTPLATKLDQDLFALARDLSLPDRVSAWQIHAGCAGVARVLHLLADLPFNNSLVLFYNLASPLMTDESGRLNPLYGPEAAHPRAARLWFSAALFGDGAAALVLSRTDEPGFSYYTRDAQASGLGPSFADPLIHHTGGGAAIAPGRRGGEAYQVYEIATEHTAVYYPRAMALNDEALEAGFPGARQRAHRYYVHQASAPVCRELYDQLRIAPGLRHVHADRYGNLSSPAIGVMLHEDLTSGAVGRGDWIILSAVGAGPERGACLLPLRVARIKPFEGSRQPRRAA